MNIIEVQTHIMLREESHDRAHVFMIYMAALKTRGQVFMYLSLIEGDILTERWNDLNQYKAKSNLCMKPHQSVKLVLKNKEPATLRYGGSQIVPEWAYY